MDALSHQIMDYLDSSQNGNKNSLKNLCHLVVLLDRYYEHKVKRLDDSLLLHMLSHLAETYVESNSYKMSMDEYLDHKKHIEQLESCSLRTESMRTAAFTRCVYFAELLLKALKNKSAKSASADINSSNEIGSDTEVNKILIDYPHA